MADTMSVMAKKDSDTIRLEKSLVRMLRVICNDQDISIGDYIGPLIEERVRADYKVAIERLIEERDQLESGNFGEDEDDEPEPAPKPKKGKKG